MDTSSNGFNKQFLAYHQKEIRKYFEVKPTEIVEIRHSFQSRATGARAGLIGKLDR